MRQKYKATLALAISVAGAGATFPISGGSFVGGLLHHGFLAATIGGMADWFAVTALFRKPLGISYRTEILKRNRERLMEAITDYAGRDLLNVDNIMKVVSQQNASRMLVEYLADRGGKERLLELTDSLTSSMLDELDVQRVAHDAAPIVFELMQQAPKGDIADKLFEALSNGKSLEPISDCVLHVVSEMVHSEEMQRLLDYHIGELLRQYEGEGSGRAFVLGLLNISNETLLDMLNSKTDRWIASAREPGETRNLLHAWLGNMFMAEGVHDTFEKIIDSMLHHLDMADLENAIEGWLKMALKSKQTCIQLVHEMAENRIDSFMKDSAQQAGLDWFIKVQIEKLVKKYHEVIPEIISDRLKEFTDEELTEFVESRTDDDLQMIRINGSIVGSLVGMMLFAITYLVGKV